MDRTVRQLSDALLFELEKALALPAASLARKVLRALFEKGAFRFSELALNLDTMVKRSGAMAGARWLLTNFVRGYEARGTDIIPGEGPLIIASNHPAAYDGMLISAYIPRADYRILIGESPPYRFLPNVSQYAIFVPQPHDPFGRMLGVRRAIQHLRNGGALLIFPRGSIEPDPAFMPHPDAEFDRWSRSLEVFLERVPRARVLVTAVSGVISKKIFRHPITWFRKARADRQRLAFMYQMIRQVSSGRELFGLTPRVTFGELLESLNPRNILTEIERAARRTLEKHLGSPVSDGIHHR